MCFQDLRVHFFLVPNNTLLSGVPQFTRQWWTEGHLGCVQFFTWEESYHKYLCVGFCGDIGFQLIWVKPGTMIAHQCTLSQCVSLYLK